MLLLFSFRTWAAADGADGTGHDGVTGGHGQDGQDGVHIGGNGGDGVSLEYTAGESLAVSTTSGINANVTDLTTLPGINNGDQLRVIVDGQATTVTINTGDHLSDLASDIDQIISPYDMSAQIDVSDSANHRLRIQGPQNFLNLQIINITGSPFSSTGITFTNLPGTLGDASPAFSHGGSGGNGGKGTVLGGGNYYFAIDSAGGAGGSGGYSDYFYGDGGHGGDGGIAMTATSNDDDYTFFSGVSVTGGHGGSGGHGGGEGVGGNGGDGGIGFLAQQDASLDIQAGAELVGGDGGQRGTGGTAGSDGSGGFGLSGSDLTVTLAGTVKAGANQATAIYFAGGANRLTLENDHSLSGNVLANGSNDALALGGDADGSFDSGSIGSRFQGFERFEKTGTSTWALTGSNDQNWWVKEGTLAGATENLGLDIRNDSHVQVTSGSAYLGVISGSGSVTWDVSGELFDLVLDKAQTYTGLTHLLPGSLVIVNSVEPFAGDIRIDADSTVKANGGANSTQYDGEISGAGKFHFNGGNVTWTRDHTGFTGDIILYHGAHLTLGTGSSTGSIVGNVLIGGTPGTLEVNRANDFTYNGSISGNGNLLKKGSGNYILSADHSMTGNATVNAGGMFVNGSMTGVAFTVNGGGLLGGSGSVGAVTSAGTLAPGNSPETMTVVGDLILDPVSILEFELDTPGVVGGGVNDLIEVNGNLTLDGALNIIDWGNYGAGTYRLINYTGDLTDNGLTIGAQPSGFNARLDTGTPGEVNLIVNASSAAGAAVTLPILNLPGLILMALLLAGTGAVTMRKRGITE